MEDIHNFCDSLLKNISNSIRERKNKTNKKLADIAYNIKDQSTKDDITGDTQMLSNIINYHIIKGKNPYLLPKPKKNNLTHNIVVNLNYGSSYNLVWNNGTVILFDNIEKIFYIGLDYLSQKNQKTIRTALLSDLHFAKTEAYKQTHSNYNEYEYKNTKEHAKNYLYETLWLEFGRAHKNYFQDLGTFKIEQNLEKFFETKFLPILEEFNRFNNPMGTFNLIIGIYKSINYKKTLDRTPLIEEKKTNDMLIKNGKGFIDALIENQDNFDNFIANKYKRLENDAKPYIPKKN